MEWVDGSDVGPLPPDRISEVRVALQDFLETPIRWPAMLQSNWQDCHGGIPKKDTFQTASGKTRRIGRYLNFLRDEDDLGAGKPTWRAWRKGDARLDYSLAVIFDDESWEPAFGHKLVPFACIDTDGKNPRACERFDLVCLDFAAQGRPPTVVTLDIDKSDYDDPVTEPVADTYEHFVASLRDGDSDWTSGLGDKL